MRTRLYAAIVSHEHLIDLLQARTITWRMPPDALGPAETLFR